MDPVVHSSNNPCLHRIKALLTLLPLAAIHILIIIIYIIIISIYIQLLGDILIRFLSLALSYQFIYIL